MHPDAVAAQPSDVATAQHREAADRVVQDADVHALCGLLREQAGHLLGERVGGPLVVEQVHRPAGATDVVEQARVLLVSVLQDLHLIARRERRLRRCPQHAGETRVLFVRVAELCEVRRLMEDHVRRPAGEDGALYQTRQLPLTAEGMTAPAEHDVDHEAAHREHEQQEEPGKRRLRAAVLQDQEHGNAQGIQSDERRQHHRPRDRQVSERHVHSYVRPSRLSRYPVPTRSTRHGGPCAGTLALHGAGWLP